MDVWIVSLILAATLVLLITEKLPVDLTAMGIIAALMVSGILTPSEAVQGFANPAVVTVGSMFIISRGMMRTGAVGFVAEKVIDVSRGKVRLAAAISLVTVAVASAFINNTPVVVLFIPIVLRLGCEYGISPSKLLIPVSYASILAGTCTLIGTSTNIIVSDLSAAAGYGGLTMFELSPLGVPIAALGILFLLITGPRLMPAHAIPTCDIGNREERRYLAEVIVPAQSPLVGAVLPPELRQGKLHFEVFELIRRSYIRYPDRERLTVQAGDTLLVKASANDLVSALYDGWFVLPHAEEDLDFSSLDPEPVVVELIIPPQASILGDRLADVPLFRDPTVHIIAVRRRALHYAEQKIPTMKTRVGDILLVHCTKDKLDQLRGGGDFIIVEDVHHEMVFQSKAKRALAIFLAVILAASFGLADIMVCAVAGAFLMLLGGCLGLRQAYGALQANVLVLIVGTIALGTAMDKTGATRIYADAFLQLFRGAGPGWVLFGIITLTSVGTLILSNNATAVLVLPVAVSAAVGLGVDPRPFIVAVCFGASACFASPVGYQTNLLVYGPGSYRFTDYLKLGVPLNLLVVAMGSLFIPVIWPF